MEREGGETALNICLYLDLITTAQLDLLAISLQERRLHYLDNGDSDNKLTTLLFI